MSDSPVYNITCATRLWYTFLKGTIQFVSKSVKCVVLLFSLYHWFCFIGLDESVRRIQTQPNQFTSMREKTTNSYCGKLFRIFTAILIPIEIECCTDSLSHFLNVYRLFHTTDTSHHNHSHAAITQPKSRLGSLQIFLNIWLRFEEFEEMFQIWGGCITRSCLLS